MKAATRDSPRIRAAICAALFAGTALLFARAMGHDFVNYDDPDYVTANAHVRAGLSLGGLRWALTSGEASNWHPLTWVSHQLDVTLFGLNPRGHHCTSVAWHAANAALAFLALRRLTGTLWTSAFCAALFAWHPLRVESVAWVAERKDVLSGFFFFAVLWLYAGYVERRRAGRGGAGVVYGLALVAFSLGLMAKPMLVTLPGVLLLLDVWPLRRVTVGVMEPAGADGIATAVRAPPGKGLSAAKPLRPAGPGPSTSARHEPWSAVWFEKLPFFALAAASAVVTYQVQKAGGSVTAALGFGARLANAVIAAVCYLGNLVVPVDLAVLYPHPGSWPTRQVVAALLVLAAVGACAVWQWRRRPWIAVGWCWFLGTLVPVAGLVQVGLQARADRYTYLTMLGVQIALLWSIRAAIATPAARRAWAWAGAVVLAAVAGRTWQQLGVWRDSFTLFDHAIAVTQNNYVAHDNRGLHLFKAGRLDEAMADYRRSLAINPGYLNANNNLGHALAEQGRPAEAVPLYRVALRAQPGHLEVHNNLANALSDLGQLDEAMEHYEFVLARRPGHAQALNGSAVVLAMKNRVPEARARLEESLRIAPDNAGAHNNLGNVFSMLGDRDAAIRHYRRATELNPQEAHAFVLIGTLLNQQGKFAEAVGSLQRALALRPANSDALAQLGFALARLGRRDEALRALQASLQQRPGDATTKAWLEAVQAMPAGGGAGLPAPPPR
jgi:tetratricopeptide (TPR) repeat protein